MDVFPLLEEIQAIARTGLHFSETEYDRERYSRLVDLTTRAYAELSEIPYKSLSKRFLSELGYITPKVGVDAAIFNEHGDILLMDRADGTGWCLPCGWVEPNEKPIEAVIRETREETGLLVQVKRLVGVFTRLPSTTNGPHTMVALVHWCETVSGSLSLSHEGLALQYWRIANVPKWHVNHEIYARAAYDMWKADPIFHSISD